jgi:hypothetical protein
LASGVPWSPTSRAEMPIHLVPRGLPGPGGMGSSPFAHFARGGYHQGCRTLVTIEKRPIGVGERSWWRPPHRPRTLQPSAGSEPAPSSYAGPRSRRSLLPATHSGRVGIGGRRRPSRTCRGGEAGCRAGVGRTGREPSACVARERRRREARGCAETGEPPRASAAQRSRLSIRRGSLGSVARPGGPRYQARLRPPVPSRRGWPLRRRRGRRDGDFR